MTYRCFFYDENAYFFEGMKASISSLFRETRNVSFSLTDDYEQLIDRTKSKIEGNHHLWFFCDLDMLPMERFVMLNRMQGCYKHQNKKLVIMLSNHHMPFFLTIYNLFPQAHWLMKNEKMEHIPAFLNGLNQKKANENRFSYSLIDYTRNTIRSGDVHHLISCNEWWLIEEILRGKSLSNIAHQADTDIRKISYVKRKLMKRLNIKNNIALFEKFKWLTPSR